MAEVGWLPFPVFPSPQPSPQRGEGVGSCRVFVMPTGSTDSIARFSTTTALTRNRQIPPFHRPTPSSPLPSGERARVRGTTSQRSEEHTSELQSRENLVCRLL